MPRLHTTPYYRIHPDPTWTAGAIAEIELLNETHAEPDHEKLREVITRYVRHTRAKVLLCSEMAYHVELQQRLLFDGLADDVKSHVVNRETYWPNDDAAAVYRHADGLIGCECHLPILCAVNGVTGFYVRQPQDTIKGQMYYDLALNDRIAEIEQVDGSMLADKFMRLIDDPNDASIRLSASMEKAHAVLARAVSLLITVISMPGDHRSASPTVA